MTEQAVLEVNFPVKGGDFAQAGEVSTKLKRVLQQLGLDAALVRRIVIATCEAELNIVIHAYSGNLKARVSRDRVEVWAEDEGPGIADVELAMQEGYTTAPDHVRALGFGAGLGLPNIKKNSDCLKIDTAVGQGTTLYIRFDHEQQVK
ncbi:MAG TPA: ATP-binding protein [Bacillota bacterium]|nr:ATP-binding protein [Bacillota bacterium]